MGIELHFYSKNFTYFTIYLHLFVAMHFRDVYYFFVEVLVIHSTYNTKFV